MLPGTVEVCSSQAWLERRPCPTAFTTGKHQRMTSASLKEKPVRDLARLAKQHGVAGWHAMRKDQLIRALVRKARSRPPVVAAARGTTMSMRAGSRDGHTAGPTVSVGLHPSVSSSGGTVRAVAQPQDSAAALAIALRLQQARERLLKAKNLATPPEGGRSPRPVRDRMVLMVRGPHWLHVFWELTTRSIARAQAALGQEWHGARPTPAADRTGKRSQCIPVGACGPRDRGAWRGEKLVYRHP